MASTSKLNDKDYTKLLHDEGFAAASHKEIAESLMKRSKML